MKFNYKWPTVSQNNVQQQILINKRTGQEVSTSEKTVAIGSATIVFYFLTLSYIYGSALFNEFASSKYITTDFDNIGEIWGIMRKFWNALKTDPISFFKLNTFSTSFQDSGKVGTTVFVIIFFALLQTLFSYQNIYSTDSKRSVIVAFNYVIVLCWLLFMFIFPTIKGTQDTSWPHVFLAFCVLLSLIINCFLIANLYSDYFDNTTIEPLTGIGYTIVAAAIVSVIAMAVNAVSSKFPYVTHKLVAGSELVCLILYAVFLIIFTQFPPVPDASLSCVLVPNSSSSQPPSSV